jgi:hypothetical protein
MFESEMIFIMKSQSFVLTIDINELKVAIILPTS